jgi:hypothetical protein
MSKPGTAGTSPAARPGKPEAVPMPPPPTPLLPVRHDWRAAFLSYLVPGLGQIVQGRVAKGLLFLACLYALFYYGQTLGGWRNVYLPDGKALKQEHQRDLDDGLVGRLAQAPPGNVGVSLYFRPQFAGQFWIGAAAWPALVQWWNYNPAAPQGPIFGNYQRALEEDEINQMQRDGDKHWDLGWVYTVIAGALNVLVIYDALAGPAFREPTAAADRQEPPPS